MAFTPVKFRIVVAYEGMHIDLLGSAKLSSDYGIIKNGLNKISGAHPKRITLHRPT